MKNSLFLDELKRPFSVPLLALEYYSLHMSPDLDDDSVLRVFEDTLKLTCGIAKPTREHVNNLLDRLQEVDPLLETSGRAQGRTLGTSFFEQIGKMDTVQLLGRMTNYNLAAMRALYCTVDFQHVKGLIRTYVEGLGEQNKVAFEAVMYGMGNSYQDEGSKVVDANSKEGLAMMRKFGVGTISTDQLSQLGIDLDLKLN